MNSDERTETLVALADLATEFWKLLQNFNRVVSAAPESVKSGLVAQAKFGARRLASILDSAGMHIETFDGVAYSANLPVTAVNADDFVDDMSPLVEQTLEPAIILGTTLVKTGRVYLRARSNLGA